MMGTPFRETFDFTFLLLSVGPSLQKKFKKLKKKKIKKRIKKLKQIPQICLPHSQSLMRLLIKLEHGREQSECEGIASDDDDG